MFYLKLASDPSHYQRTRLIHTLAGAVPFIGPHVAAGFTPQWMNQGSNILVPNVIGAGLGGLAGLAGGTVMGYNPLHSGLLGAAAGGAMGSFLGSTSNYAPRQSRLHGYGRGLQALLGSPDVNAISDFD